MKILRILIVAAGLALASGSWALGLGKVALESGLNDPFRANIPLIGSSPDFADRVVVTLADAEQFKKAGIQRFQLLTSLKFEVVQDEDSGPKFIRITSEHPIREPFLNFVLDVSSPDGRLLQEITILLTPNTALPRDLFAPLPLALSAGT